MYVYVNIPKTTMCEQSIADSCHAMLPYSESKNSHTYYY